MGYSKTNKQAWEEAFDNRNKEFGADMVQRLKTEDLPYFNPMLRQTLQSLDFKGKVIAQFCCNNGRELLSAMQLGAAKGFGFDIAENMVAFANDAARQAAQDCTFTACDILDIGREYDGTFDLVMFTIGAITWFEDLNALFAVAARCLKPGGTLLLNDFHPFVNMLPFPGEDGFDAEKCNRVMYSYFRSEPWLENNSGGYMTDHRNTHTFVSFTHTMAAIINAVVRSGLRITMLDEYDRDVGVAEVYEGKGFPLSFTLLADKR